MTPEEAVEKAMANFVCEVCGGREVVCIDDGGPLYNEDDEIVPEEPWAGVAMSAWQCTSCGVMMGVNMGDDED